jgi:tRNA (uracil-5-)-methyltransferase TRM9
MNDIIQAQLLDLNRRFYAAVGVEFDRTRQSLPTGMVDLARRVQQMPAARILDAGCGNGRFARALAQVGATVTYHGVDADPQLLALAAAQTQDLPGIAATFQAADLAAPGWAEAAPGEFDAVVCLAVLHHFPGYALRQRIVADLAGLLAPRGVLALSTWQFGSIDRFVDRQVAWDQIGLAAEDVEPGDALLPWNQGVYALRYVHQLDLAEIEQLAAGAGLRIAASFRSDGKEGNLNLYTLLAAI